MTGTMIHKLRKWYEARGYNEAAKHVDDFVQRRDPDELLDELQKSPLRKKKLWTKQELKKIRDSFDVLRSD